MSPSARPSASARSLYAKRSLIVLSAVMALTFGALAAASFAGARVGGGSLLPAVAGLLCAVFYARTPVVKRLSDRLEIKAAPLAARQLVAYDEIRGLEVPGARKALLVVEQGGRTRRVRLPLHLLAPADAAGLLASLRALPFARPAA